MCQLLALSANQPVSAAFSLGGFFKRGGLTDHHADGWGLGYYQGPICHVLTDERPAARSPLAHQVLADEIRSRTLIAHVRKATQGEVSLRNCHPFRRELWGKTWVFAHNGDLRGSVSEPDGSFQPLGDTDSERAFCILLNALVRHFGPVEPPRREVAATLRRTAALLAGLGPFNFLLSDGDAIFAHCSTHLHYVARRYPFARARLVDGGDSIDFAQVNQRQDRVLVVATQPLTCDEAWQALAPGELKVFARGSVWQADPAAPPRAERVLTAVG